MAEKMTGGRIVLESLLQEKVEYIFGYPGGVLLPLFDELHKLKSDQMKFVLVRHEQGGGHMAEGYAKTTGKPGVLLVTSGPGATNVVTAVTDAMMDSVPMVVLTGQVVSSLIGGDAFQEADITGITRTVTKHNYLVKDVKDVARVIKEAFHIATTGRPGPVLIDIPKDVLTSTCEFRYPDEVHIRGYNPTVEGDIRQIHKAADIINNAQRPFLYVGGGAVISGAHEEVRQLAEKAKIPTTTTLMGLGAFPGTHELFVGMPGMHGSYAANMGFTECDVVIAVGARFDDRVTGKLSEFAPNATIVQADIDPTSISKNVLCHCPIVGDCKRILKELIKHVAPQEERDWNRLCKKRWAEHPFQFRPAADGHVKGPQVIEDIWKLTEGKDIVATDVGQHQMWSAQFYKFDRPSRWVTSGGLGTMGFGLPAAIGAAFGNPGQTVWCITGDGSIQMCIQELLVASEYKLPVKVILLNNNYLGMVRQWQELFFEKRYSGVDLSYSPDFIKLAESYHVPGMTVTKDTEIIPALKKARETEGPFFLEFKTRREDAVFPMVPAGAALKDIILGEEFV